MINLKVSQLMDYLKNITRRDYVLSKVQIEGEISNYTHHSNGNLYFTLKEDVAKIDCIMFRWDVEKQFKVGDHVLATGAVTIRESDGTISLQVNKIEAFGLGKIHERFEKLKLKLQKEGYFDVSKKKELPLFPQKVGVITSPTGAAIRDIIRTGKGKNPYTDIILYPSVVQGPYAPESLIKGLEYFEDSDVDVVIIGRGGGAYEDLDAFNSEELAMKIFHHPKPIVSGVGHAVDTVISDFVADKMAVTPTAAADLVFFDMDEYVAGLKTNLEKIQTLLFNNLNMKDTHLKYLREKISSLSVDRQIDDLLTDFSHRLEKSLFNIQSKVGSEERKLDLYRQDLDPKVLESRIDGEYQKIQRYSSNIHLSIGERLDNESYNLLNLRRRLDRQDIEQIINDGFALVLDMYSDVKRDMKDIDIGDRLELLMRDGTLDVQVVEKRDKHGL